MFTDACLTSARLIAFSSFASKPLLDFSSSAAEFAKIVVE